jgi:hypothetical protein
MVKSLTNRFYGVVVSTLDFESSDLGLTPIGPISKNSFSLWQGLITIFAFYKA